MANNRMWLRCTVCGEHKMIAKFYPTITQGWYTPTGWGDDKTSDERAGAFIGDLDRFLEAHSFCDTAGGVSMWGNRRFELEYEIPEEVAEERSRV